MFACLDRVANIVTSVKRSHILSRPNLQGNPQRIWDSISRNVPCASQKHFNNLQHFMLNGSKNLSISIKEKSSGIRFNDVTTRVPKLNQDLVLAVCLAIGLVSPGGRLNVRVTRRRPPRPQQHDC